jgi:GT2 family glycosyltransferase
MDSVGVVVVHYGEIGRTLNCLDSLVVAVRDVHANKVVANVTILVIDNSGNVYPEIIDSRYNGSIRCVSPSKNLGYAGACSLGAKLLSQVSVLVFLNNDVVLNANALSSLLTCMRCLPDVGALQPSVVKSDNSGIDSLGLTFSPLMNPFNYANWNVPQPRTFQLENGSEVTECFGVDGMLVVVGRNRFEEVGGWDPDFFMFSEDALLSWKLRLQGYKNYVCRDSVVYHERGGTAKGYLLKVDPRFPGYYVSRNRILTALYVYEPKWLLRYLFPIMVFEFAKNVYLSIRRHHAAYVYYYFGAIRFIFSHRKHINAERGKVVRKVDMDSFLRRGQMVGISDALRLISQKIEQIMQ